LIPANLPDPFGSQDLARTLRIPRTLAQKMLYCLREMGILHVTGKQGNNLLYQLNPLWDSQHG
jgi:DNA-binding IclR family transcriptional regulator